MSGSHLALTCGGEAARVPPPETVAGDRLDPAHALVGPDTSEWALGAWLVMRWAGLGAVFVPAMAATYYGLPNEAYPRATSAVRSFQQVGASFGTAVLAVILQHQLAGHAADPSGLATAFGHTFWWAVGLTALAFVPALLLPRTRPSTNAAEGPAPTAEAPARAG